MRSTSSLYAEQVVKAVEALRYIATRTPSQRDDNLRPLVADLQETARQALDEIKRLDEAPR